jgi:CheY-like chemotaxis protein
MIFLLEDNPDRLAAMLAVLRDLLPTTPVHVEDDAAKSNAWLAAHQHELILISLDHDLDSVPRADGSDDQHGCGRDVVNHLVLQPPTCPVIIHTTNWMAGDGMFFALKHEGWPVYRVYPRDHHDWVATDWKSTLMKLRDTGWLR